ncbi:MAG: hypothetical protein Q9170_002825 [Blastenia crenularia]
MSGPHIMQSASPSKQRETSPPSKPHLTEEDRKARHIDSENRRRSKIRNEFAAMTKLIPGVDVDAGKSETYVLTKYMEFAKEQVEKRKVLLEKLAASGVNVERELQISKDPRGPQISAGEAKRQGPKRKRAEYEKD